MGATNIVDVAWGYGPGDMKRAYSDIVADAVEEYGYRYDSGEISATSGVTLSSFSEKKPIREDKVTSDIINTIHNRTHKHNPVEAIYVSQDNRTRKESFTVTTRFRVQTGRDEIEWSPYSSFRNTETMSEIRKKARTRITKMVNNGEIVSPKSGMTLEKGNDFETSIQSVRIVNGKKKHETVVTDGKRVTKYFILDNDRFTPKMPQWEDGYASQAEARKNLSEDMTIGSQQEIIAITRRENGDSLVTHKTIGYTTKTVEVEVDVVITVMEDSDTPDATGWMFIGWAAE